ncbi:hypothetical protein [Deinococcus aestuarii]|uniref:hypothetical protein n=1 Tax=Deinococcus aestuarii TaxID=2774531 RepID=UPI001C0E0DCC|nr:hypothetical protein [Deinococcus aestuarii]
MKVALDVSALALRQAIGGLGLLMPLVVWSIGQYDGLPVHIYDTISAHYYSRARDLFVGTMALVGVLIFFYRSPYRWDEVVAKVTGVAAVFVGLLPMTPSAGMRADTSSSLALGLHPLPVTAFFVGGIFLVGVSFRRTTLGQLTGEAPGHLATIAELERQNPRKHRRNRLYLGCAGVMSLGALVLAAQNVLSEQFGWPGGWRFVPESTAVMAFALAWLVKGQAWAFVRD